MKHFLVLIPLLYWSTVSAQHSIGLPGIVNYTKTQYQGNGQTWDADTDHNGILYFANNEGLLTFNGHYWQLFPVPNNTRLRAVKVAGDGRIYVGAQDDFGYYLPDKNGILRYTSLKKNIPAGQQEFADIWNIAGYNNRIYFRSNNKIFEYNGQTIRVYTAPSEWKIMGSTPAGIYAQDQHTGLLRMQNGQWQNICPAIAQKQLLVTAIPEEQHDTLLLATLKDGLFKLHRQQLIPFHTAADAIFRNSRIYCAIALRNNQLAVGTFSQGCFIIDKSNGRIVRQFTMEEGLQNNNVLKLLADQQQNIWLTLDNGIDLLQYNTAIKQIFPDKRNSLAAYAACIFQQQLYIGTNDGLFRAPLDSMTDFSLSSQPFQPVPQTKGQVWRLQTVDQHLLMGHHEGTFEIQHNKAIPLLKDAGSWLYLPMARQLLIGCYNGLASLPRPAGSTRITRHIPGLYESLRFLATDSAQRIWASHPYRGVYQLTLQGDTVLHSRLYTQKDGLPATNNNYVFRIRDKMVVATMQGIYEYNDAQQRFIRSPQFFSLLGPVSIQYLTADNYGHLWFVADRQPGVIDLQQHTITRFPELTGKIVSGFEFIYPYNEENIFFGGEKGIFHLNYKKYHAHRAGPRVLLGRITATGSKDSLLYGGYGTRATAALVTLPHAYRDFRFEYATPAADHTQPVRYRYQLIGLEEHPGEWTTKTEKEYTNLPHGAYTFTVTATNNQGTTTAMARFPFIIRPAWYQTLAARIGYLLLLVAFLFYLLRKQRQKLAAQQEQHRKVQEHLIFLHQLELERNEKQLIRLRNEKLEADVQHKNKELASATMNLVQKGKMLSHIKDEFLQSIKKTGNPAVPPPFKKVLRLFEAAENNEEDWTQFSQHFDEVHNNFLLTLKKKFPELTTTDLKLCAYLRINLTTKEIAQSMGISVRGVETSRYRLRKKLDLPGDTTLYDFLITISPAG
ncbi:triple tyrosine motif-containing protein [Chitinophaga nivalis]|uniref:LuxR C-terminal-related transcriptional regulator n=1 Tax=Chitinophaga nivalis TaxID=2991709 RepID=A0ABT3IHX3_9BACT|nr:triple tyrosine motif-containing protein [Chitinophaga nivalis]MCW3466770.1 LuxR C-terminal-related transcriptional regulator [Chitinophaga nivalis]MCW3483539.1 LuxR C-terminal-related transcriptional regulator [Chitinophaga nivalis]